MLIRVGDAVGSGNAGRKLGDRPQDVDMRHLEGSNLVLAQGTLTANGQHRAFGPASIGDASNGTTLWDWSERRCS